MYYVNHCLWNIHAREITRLPSSASEICDYFLLCCLKDHLITKRRQSEYITLQINVEIADVSSWKQKDICMEYTITSLNNASTFRRETSVPTTTGEWIFRRIAS